jgi:glycerate kinase
VTARPWRVVIAPDSFKGSISAAGAARAIAAGWRAARSGDDLVLRPVADGGEGTLAAFEAAVPGARRVPVVVPGPDDAPVAAHWLLLPGGAAVVELACSSGIELLGSPPRLRPLDAHTAGFGAAVAAALDSGVDRLVLGIGSSASTDGGTGLLAALGARFTDRDGRPVVPGARGLDALAHVERTGLRPPPPGGAVVLSDVTHPLTGPGGAAAVFGPQKGLTGDDARRADAGLARLARLLGVDPATPGTGAAGGTGAALLAWGARLLPGAPEVAELVGLRAALTGADLVITGEGAYDAQSAAGKAPAFVAALARELGVAAALVAGRVGTDAPVGVTGIGAVGGIVDGFAAVRSLTALAGSVDAALADPTRWLRAAGAELAAALGGCRGRPAHRRQTATRCSSTVCSGSCCGACTPTSRSTRPGSSTPSCHHAGTSEASVRPGSSPGGSGRSR